MKKSELLELKDKILNPVSILKFACEDEKSQMNLDRIVEYIRSLESED